jgi:hypothetical protein
VLFFKTCKLFLCVCNLDKDQTAYNTYRRNEYIYAHIYIYIYIQRGSKKCTHFLIVNIFVTKRHVVTILARYCSAMFAHVSSSQDGAPPHYHRHVRAYLNDTLTGRWIGRRGAIEHLPRSPDLTPLDFYQLGNLEG